VSDHEPTQAEKGILDPSHPSRIAVRIDAAARDQALIDEAAALDVPVAVLLRRRLQAAMDRFRLATHELRTEQTRKDATR
jgi:hypothetical protein